MNDFAWKVLTMKNGETCLFSVGQAGYIIKSKRGQLLGVDLYLSDCVERLEGHIGFKRLLPKILFPYDLEFDAVIATHSHLDHYDIDSMPELITSKKTKLYASLNCSTEIERMRAARGKIYYVRTGDLYNVGDYVLEFVDCDHGLAEPSAVGVVITVDRKRIYIAGDTCLRLDYAERIADKGKLDIMIAPINGAFGNMNEKDCAELSKVLKPQLTIPSHYGMFASHGGNPGVFIDRMNETCPDNKYFIMAYGEGITI